MPSIPEKNGVAGHPAEESSSVQVSPGWINPTDANPAPESSRTVPRIPHIQDFMPHYTTAFAHMMGCCDARRWQQARLTLWAGGIPARKPA